MTANKARRRDSSKKEWGHIGTDSLQILQRIIYALPEFISNKIFVEGGQ